MRTTFTVSVPSDTHGEVTVVGTGHAGIESTVFRPNDLLLDVGHEVTVVGVLKVVAHPSPAVAVNSFRHGPNSEYLRSSG